LSHGLESIPGIRHDANCAKQSKHWPIVGLERCPTSTGLG
jgi:hypothetical protein